MIRARAQRFLVISGVCALAGLAQATDCWKIVTGTFDIIPDLADGARCGGLCASHTDWAPGGAGDCEVPGSSSPQNVVCSVGTVTHDQFGIAHCSFVRGLDTFVIGTPYCVQTCPLGGGGGGGEQ